MIGTTAENETMVQVGSFVFLDLETTGLPYKEGFRTKITELAMVSVNRDHILSSELGYLPRVLQKLVLCFDPRRVISDVVGNVTGLSNKVLKNVRQFDRDAVNTIRGFLDRQQRPVCFVVHNGNSFDYPILRAEIDDLQMELAGDIVCVDSLRMFRQFYKKKVEKKPKLKVITQGYNSKKMIVRLNTNKSDWEVLNNIEKSAMCNKGLGDNSQANSQQSQPSSSQNASPEEYDDDMMFDLIDEVTYLPDPAMNSSTGSQNNANTSNRINQDLDVGKYIKKENSTITPLDENIFLNDSKKPAVKKVRESFKLGELYIRLLGKEPMQAHQAEGDCLMLLECCIVDPKRFVEYCDGNSKPFASIPRMQSKFHNYMRGLLRPTSGSLNKTGAKLPTII